MDFIERAAKKIEGKEKSSLLERAVDKMVGQPEAKGKVAEAKAEPSKTEPTKSASQRKSRQGTIDLVSLKERGFIVPDAPPNITAEEFRLIKRSLLVRAAERHHGGPKNSNMILVTSSQPGEGKTFCSINLALSIASEQDYTVLLVDADFAKPEVLSTLGLEGGKGLVDVIADRNLDLSDCLIRTNVPNLAVLPAGRQHHLTTELLASDRMEEIVDEIAQRYPDRIIIFDSPPALASSAASVLAMHMGQTVFVVESERTSETQVRESLSLLAACPNVNMLLNKTQVNFAEHKFGTYYAYEGRE
ncbi:MAG: XrtA-associated tyrosine autokinase [Sphingomonadales bacterium]|jgi:receptor protein-tyrosine kinase